jgi:hypothetical protein
MAMQLELTDKWSQCLLEHGETDMGYQTASITLQSGRVIELALLAIPDYRK